MISVKSLCDLVTVREERSAIMSLITSGRLRRAMTPKPGNLPFAVQEQCSGSRGIGRTQKKRAFAAALWFVMLFFLYTEKELFYAGTAKKKGSTIMKAKKIITAVCAAALALCMTACGADSTREGGTITTADLSMLETVTETAEAEDFSGEEAPASAAADGTRTIEDREGNIIEVRENVQTIVSAAPSISEILSGLGLANKVVAADIYSADVDGIDPSVCTLDFYNLNIEELTALSPDLVIVSGMSMSGADDPYAALKDSGVNVIYIPTSNSIAGIKLDIEFLAGYLLADRQGAELIADITDAVNDISEKAAGITDKKSVYFEMGAAPYLYTCGNGTFINEIITLAGAENIYGGEEGWLSNSEESVIAADPDVIITNVQYDGYDYNEIKSRPGWENISAVKNGEVYCVDANETSRPSQHIVGGMYQIAEAIYPEVFAE